jgi:hypothetical protein
MNDHDYTHQWPVGQWSVRDQSSVATRVEACLENAKLKDRINCPLPTDIGADDNFETASCKRARVMVSFRTPSAKSAAFNSHGRYPVAGVVLGR